jgi:hypothetical protein
MTVWAWMGDPGAGASWLASILNTSWRGQNGSVWTGDALIMAAMVKSKSRFTIVLIKTQTL